MNTAVIVQSCSKGPFIPCANIQTAYFYVKEVEKGEELNWYYDVENWVGARWFVTIPGSEVN